MATSYKGLSVPEYGDSADAPGAITALIDSGPIPRFANPSERDAAIPAPTKGNVAYMLDTGRLLVFDGNNWTAPFALLSGAIFTGDVTARRLYASAPSASGGAPNVYMASNGQIARSSFSPASSTHTHPYVPDTLGGIERAGNVDNWRKTSFFDVLTFNVAKPAGWTRYTLTVEADGQFASLNSGTVQINSRVAIGSSASPSNTSPAIRSTEGGHFQPIGKHGLTGITGNVTVKVQYQIERPLRLGHVRCPALR